MVCPCDFHSITIQYQHNRIWWSIRIWNRDNPDTQVGSTTASFLSSVAPQITPYSSILVSCNLVNNRAVIPSNILSSYTPLGTNIGSLFTFEPNYLQFADVEDWQYR